jgi:hypothetical protein
MTDVKRSTAACKPPATSPIVWETSVAASMARSAIPGWDVDCGISVFKFVNSAPDEVNEAGTFGYPRERSLAGPKTFGYPRQAP